ncbi:cation transporter [Pilosibacter fragilis]|uniref:cation transporter n=1 Tax=Pilosibacter fragilis TaxID=3078042 RepID=UPI003CCE7F12
MQEKYNVTGMTCAACQARVQKSVSNLTGVQECNVNLLKNSIDDVTAMIAGQIGQLLPMDEETIKQFQTLAKKMMEQAEESNVD